MTQSNHDAVAAGSEGEDLDDPNFIDDDELEEGAYADGEDLPAGSSDAIDVMPDEFESVSTQVEGYWDPKRSGPMTWIPRGIRLSDSNQDEKKSSALCMGTLAAPCMLVTTEKDKAKRRLVTMPKGTSVGVYLKAGMRDLEGKGGATVWMGRNGTKEIPGRDQAMALFKIGRVKGSPKGEKLELIEDQRNTSLIEPVNEKSPPWYLAELFEDGGFEIAEKAMEARQAAIKAERDLKSAKGGQRTTRQTPASA